MPVGMLRSERPQLRQIIATERAALEADRFHWTEVLRNPALRVQPEMSNLQGQVSDLPLKIGHFPVYPEGIGSIQPRVARLRATLGTRTTNTSPTLKGEWHLHSSKLSET